MEYNYYHMLSIDENLYMVLFQVRFLKGVGGNSADACLANYFRCIFARDEDVSMHISWKGRPHGMNRLKLNESRLSAACLRKFLIKFKE